MNLESQFLNKDILVQEARLCLTQLKAMVAAKDSIPDRAYRKAWDYWIHRCRQATSELDRDTERQLFVEMGITHSGVSYP